MEGGDGINRPPATAGDDELYGGDGRDWLEGLAGADTLAGGQDEIADTLDGGDGADLIIVYSHDAVDGGPGDDLIRLTAAMTAGPLQGGQGWDTLELYGDVTLLMFGRSNGFEAFRSNNGALLGSEAADDVDLDGLAFEPGHAVRVYAAGGADRVSGGSDADILLGEAGDDTLAGQGGDDSIEGGPDDDLLTGGLGSDSLFGGDGTDTLRGGDDADVLDGGADLVSDDLFGEGGRDTLIAQLGDNLDGGDGDDVLVLAGPTPGRLQGGAGFDTLHLQTDVTLANLGPQSSLEALRMEDAVVRGTSGGDRLDFSGMTVTGGRLQVFAADGADSLTGGAGSDVLDGGAGDDLLLGGLGMDRLAGGDGLDTVSWSGSLARVTANLATGAASAGTGQAVLSGIEHLLGSGLGDTLTGDEKSNRLEGGGGDDTLDGGPGGDTLVGAEGADTAWYNGASTAVSVTLTGSAQDTGGGGVDVLSGIENLVGSRFSDYLRGDGADNTLSGSFGDDTLVGGMGDDVLNGFSGFDTVAYFGGPVAVGGVRVDLSDLERQDTGGAGVDRFIGIEAVIGTNWADLLIGDRANNSLRGNGGDDRLSGADGADKLYGLGGADTLEGGAGADYMAGGTEADRLDGGSDNDTLLGDSGDDTLTGGRGADQLTGGSGADVFVFLSLIDSTPAAAGRDTLRDFSVAGGDLIDLSALDAASGIEGDQSFVLVAKFTGVAGQLTIGGGKKFTLVEADTTGDGVADFSLYLLGGLTLTTNDFVL